MKTQFLGFIILLVIFGTSQKTFGQACDANTPTYNVDFTNDPNSNWVSPSVKRLGLCCDATDPDRCIEFIVTLHPTVLGISIEITSGAEPSGSMFYMSECGNQTAIGDTMCLNGVGPHRITFCKPGANPNEYTIYPVGYPDISDPIIVSDGCIDTLFAHGLQESTIKWTSISPGVDGEYNEFLSCSLACDTTIVTAQTGAPDSVFYEVRGMLFGACGSAEVVDTVAVYFVSDKEAQILPKDAAVCYGQTDAVLKASGIGGAPPYSYLWNTGATEDSIVVGAGEYWVMIQDTMNCPPVYDTVDVVEFTADIVAEAGPDQLLCEEIPIAQLAGSVQVASGGVWTGGLGTFDSDSTNLAATYAPTTAEIDNKELTLYLTSTGNGGCPPHTDSISIIFSEATVADFSFTEYCFGQPTSFSNTSTFDNNLSISWRWDYGDGTPESVNFDDSHTYSESGVYNVMLEITSDNLCIDQVTHTISVYPIPDADFTKENTCLNSATVFTDLSEIASGSIIAWDWNFGDGGTSNIQNPKHLFSTFGGYIVNFKVTSDQGCSKDTTKAINISETFPTASFSIDKTIANPDEQIRFIDASTSDVVDWFWDFGDSSGTATSREYTYSYADTGFFSPMLVVSDIEGCKDTAYSQLIIQLPPLAPNAFTPNGDGTNDLFYVRGGPYLEFDLKIYNEWGEVIYEAEDEELGWDGNRDGKKMPIGVYVYILFAETFDGEEYKEVGDINLIR